MKAKKNSILSKLSTPGPNDDSSNSSGSVNRRYQDLAAEEEASPFD